MKQHFSLLAVVAIATASLFISCKKDPDTKPRPEAVYNAYVLNEGNWGGNNASLSLMSTADGSIKNGHFAAVNGRGLGDQAQDIKLYGSKMYVTVTESKTLEVINPATGASISQITLSGGPRSMVCHNGKIYVSCYNKTVVKIDTTSLQLEGSCRLTGLRPEQMAIVGNNLYVVNSYERDAAGNSVYDSTLSVVDLSSFTEIGKITVGVNPIRVKALDDRRLVVSYNGDYSPAIPAGAVIVEPTTPSTATITALPVALSNFVISGNNIYGYTTVYDATGNPSTQIFQIDASTLQATRILEAYGAELNNTYGIDIDTSGNLYVCNGPYRELGDVYCFNANHTKLWNTEAGHLPSHIVFF